MVGDSWWQLFVTGYFAVLSTQLRFLGHDAGHRQIFRSARRNYRLGVVLANLGVGFSYGWWVDKHNRHHAHPNDEDKDPDIGTGALIFTTRQARASGRVARAFYRYQAWTFVPGLLLRPNHKGMPPLSPTDNADYLRRQVLASRNVRGHWLTDFALGGPQLSDRAPPVPVDAEGQSAPGPATGQGLSARASTCLTSKPD